MKSKKIIRASAGTGKTFRLALEYIYQVFVQSGDYKKILFLTFTNEATRELKERVFNFMEDIISHGETSEIYQHIRDLYPDFSYNQGEFQKNYQNLLKNKESLGISTIDSFSREIFKGSISGYLGLNTFGNESSKEAKEKSGTLLKHLLNKKNLQGIKDIFGNFEDESITSFISYINELDRERYTYQSLKQKDLTLLTPKGEGYLDDIYRELFVFLKNIELIREFHSQKNDKNDGLEVYFSKEGYALLAPVIIHMNDSEHVKQKLKKGLLELAKLSKNIYNGQKTKAKENLHIKEALIESQEKIVAAAKKATLYFEVIPFEQRLLEELNMILDITSKVTFDKKKLSFSDITNYTAQNLYNEELGLVQNGLVTKRFFDVLGTEIRALFLDEAQDTSVNQWKIIEPLAKSCETFIIVGDEKQSLYSWRGGEKELFTSTEKKLGLTSDRLEYNWRSEPVIVDFYNYIFSKVDKDFSWEYQEVKTQKELPSGYVELNTNLNIYEKIARDIKRHFINYSNIGIIARGHSDLELIQAELKKEHIPFIVKGKTEITETPIIKEILNLVYFLAYGDRLALLAFLRGKLLGIDDITLKYFTTNYHLLNSLSSLDLDNFSANIKETLEVINKLEEDLKELPAGVFFKNLIQSFPFVDTFTKVEDYQNLNHFLELAYNHESVYSFLVFLNENKGEEALSLKRSSTNNAVELTTIHGSKGLEYDNVYFIMQDKIREYNIGASFADGSMHKKLTLLKKYDDDFHEVEDYLLVNSKYAKVAKGHHLYQKEEAVFLDEYLNLLYVTLTRPKTNLFIWVHPSKPLKGDPELVLKDDLYLPIFTSYFGLSVTEFMEQRHAAKGDFVVRESSNDDNKNEVEDTYNTSVSESDSNLEPVEVFKNKRALKELYNLAKDNKRVPNESELTLDGEFKRKTGTAIHYALEVLRGISESDFQFMEKLLYRKYGNLLSQDTLVDITNRVKKYVLDNPQIFATEEAIYKEFRLKTRETDEAGKEFFKTHIIDRLHINHSTCEVSIYDFKSGHSRDREQLERYEGAILSKLKEIFPKVEYRIKESNFISI